jgi:hypothetical protein
MAVAAMLRMSYGATGRAGEESLALSLLPLSPSSSLSPSTSLPLSDTYIASYNTGKKCTLLKEKRALTLSSLMLMLVRCRTLSVPEVVDPSGEFWSILGLSIGWVFPGFPAEDCVRNGETGNASSAGRAWCDGVLGLLAIAANTLISAAHRALADGADL